jgi:hypothetical protein
MRAKLGKTPSLTNRLMSGKTNASIPNTTTRLLTALPPYNYQHLHRANANDCLLLSTEWSILINT